MQQFYHFSLTTQLWFISSTSINLSIQWFLYNHIFPRDHRFHFQNLLPYLTCFKLITATKSFDFLNLKQMRCRLRAFIKFKYCFLSTKMLFFAMRGFLSCEDFVFISEETTYLKTNDCISSESLTLRVYTSMLRKVFLFQLCLTSQINIFFIKHKALILRTNPKFFSQ